MPSPRRSLVAASLGLSAFVAFVGLTACQGEDATSTSASATEAGDAPRVVTADIQAGIERHIAERTAEGDGVFRLDHEGGTLEMRLVRVHTEYLSNLGPGRHFACVDLADEHGDVYDVDFFLEGDPGDMTVTETTVHKLNGKPYYLWEQTGDGTWVRAETAAADVALLGVIEGRDAFTFDYTATVPELDGPTTAWIPIAESDPWQDVAILSINVPGTSRMITDAEHGNRVMVLELDAQDSGRTIAIRYDVDRREKSAYEPAGDDASASRFLAPERLVPMDPSITRTAARVTAGIDGDLARARALYDHTIDEMKYAKVGDGYGRGDALYACEAKHGNCTDFHAYFIAHARAAGIPARFAIGAPVPSNRDEGGISGYHCWAEFFAEGKWWPVDISEADKYTPLATYYFGRHPANRIEFSRGRDLVLDPGPSSGPINYLAYPLFETAGGEARTVKPRFTFQRKPVAG